MSHPDPVARLMAYWRTSTLSLGSTLLATSAILFSFACYYITLRRESSRLVSPKASEAPTSAGGSSSSMLYQKLRPEHHEIRLLLLEEIPAAERLSAAGSLKLRGRLVPISLDLYREYRNAQMGWSLQQYISIARLKNPLRWFRPSFCALSYVWGDPTPVREIEIDGKNMKVTHNLGVAIEAILTSTSYRVIWVDALCINQDDQCERSWQVKQMGRIYSRAEAVVSYLGPQEDDSDRGMLALQELHESIEKIKFSGDCDEDTELLGAALIEFRKLREADIPSIAHILQRQYWGRVWVIQELALCRKSLFICGKTSAVGIAQAVAALYFCSELKGVRERWRILEFYDETAAATASALFPVLNMYRENNFTTHLRHLTRYREPNMASLMSESSYAEWCNATDPRDYVYALLPLSVDEHGIEPDYSKTPEEVFQAVTNLIFDIGQERRLVCMADSDLEPNFPALPSWVPDWSRQTPSGVMSISKYLFKLEPSDAIDKLHVTRDELALRGCVIGVIKHISFGLTGVPDVPIQGSEAKLLPKIREWISELASTPICQLFEPTNDAKKTIGNSFSRAALARTLVGDVNHAKGLPYGDYALEMLDFISDDAFLNSILSEKSWLRTEQASVDERKAKIYDAKKYVRIIRARHSIFGHHICTIGDEGQYLGLITKCAREGDVLVWLEKTDEPCILRRKEDSQQVPKLFEGYQNLAHDTRFRMVGNAYVDEIMNGEFFTPENRATARPFILA